jgi:hypothetical protein
VDVAQNFPQECQHVLERVASASVRDGVSPQAIVFGPEYGNEDDQQNGSLICRRGCTGSISPDSLAPAA